MMKEILITSSALILALLLIRRVFRGVLSRRFQYALWALVLVRLLVPMDLLPAADFSLLTAARPVEQAVAGRVNQPLYFRPQGQVSAEELERRDISVEYIPTAQDGFVMGESEGFGQPTRWLVRDPETNTVTRYAEMTVGPWDILDRVWKVGMVLMGAFFVVSNLGFYLRLRKSRKTSPWGGGVGEADEGGAPSTEDNALLSDRLPPSGPCGATSPQGRGYGRKVYLVPEGLIPSPCLFGRSIYLTPAVAEDPAKLRHVLAHEETHAKHWDPLWSLLRCLCLTVYWFDPLVWIAAACSKTDCELACDESVLNTLGEAERIPYGQTLVSLIPVKRVSNPMIAATTMTAGKKQLKDRVQRIAKKPRQLMAVALAVAVLAGVVSACTFTAAAPTETVVATPFESQEPQGLRSLTGEELRWFNEEFFNHFNSVISYTYNIRNQFISSLNLYEKPEDIDLYELFYCDGDVYDDPENDICPSFKITEAQINAILTQYTGLTLEQTNKVNFTYEYNDALGAYTWAHGDTNYPGDIEILYGTREGSTVKLYHHGWSSGSQWYCTTLEDRADEDIGPYRAEEGVSRYWFVSNVESEKPAIPTPLPAWEPEAVVSLKELEPYVAPTVVVERHQGDFDGNYRNRLENWDIGGHNVVIYRATDGNVYAAERLKDGSMNVFLSGLGDNVSMFLYNDLFGHDGFYVDHYGPYETLSSLNSWPLRDYYYFNPDGVLTLLVRCPLYDGNNPRIMDLDGDGQDELIGSRQFFFLRDGMIYQAPLAPEDRLPGPVESTQFDPYSRSFLVRGYTETFQEWTRYLYFDGESLFIYKNEKPTTDHIVDGVDQGVPRAVVEAARDFVEHVCIEAALKVKEAHLQKLIDPQTLGDAPPEYDDWRLDYFVGPHTYSYGGATVEGWWFNYELHTPTPERVVLAGGKYLTEDNWVSPGYPGCDALFFEVKSGGTYRLLDSGMIQADPESYHVNQQVLSLMESNGVELTDGSTYAGLFFWKRLERLTDPTLAGNEMRIQYDDGQGQGGAYIIDLHDVNVPYYLNRIYDPDQVVWSRVEGKVKVTAGPSVIFSSLDWHDVLQFWPGEDGSLVMYKEQNQDPEWYEARYSGAPAQDVFAYRAVPYYWARCWFDDAEMERYLNTALGDHGDGDYQGVAMAYLALYEEVSKRNATPGGRYACTYVKVTNVEILEDQPESWSPADILDYPHFAFSYDVIFVPENEDALNTLMAGNTGEYEGNDPDVPQGAFEYSRRGSMYLMDGYWHCGGIGTG